MTTAVKLYTPLASVPVVVPVKVHDEEITTASVNPVLAKIPAPFSTFTWKEARVAPETVVEVGSTEKASFEAVVGYTAIAPLVAVRLGEFVVSVAVKVQEVPAENETPGNCATPAVATTVNPDAVSVQPADDVSDIESIEPVPVVITVFVLSSTETEKLVMACPRVAAAGGATVKTIWDGAPAAEAGDSLTSSAPVAKRAEQAPIERTLLSVERSDRPPPRFLITCMAIPLSNKYSRETSINALSKG
jgi:hypothetical protein